MCTIIINIDIKMIMLQTQMQSNWKKIVKNLVKLLFITVSFIAISHCTTITPSVTSSKAAPADTSITWEQREQRLQQINHWTSQGAISVRTPDTSGSASINWEQTPNHYHIRIFGPLGAGQIKLDGSPEQVTMTTSKGEQFRAATAEQLLAEQTGWYLPISSLNYWIRGLPAPGIVTQKQLDSSQRLQTLSQQGWTIQYLDYRNVRGIDLPRRISLSNGTVNAKLVINRWRI